MTSCIYAGSISHRRLNPVRNQFRYDMFMMYLDLERIDEIFERFWLWSARRPAPAWFRRRDHLGDIARPLADCVRDLVERESGVRPSGPVYLLTHLRYFGYCFNPVSFYYCFDLAGRVSAIVMEVNNTWHERHAYVLPLDDTLPGGTLPGETIRKRDRMSMDFDKKFHVSPFLPMDMRYRCRMTEPGERLLIAIENWQDSRKVFDAHLNLRREPITHAGMAHCLARDPLITLRVTSLILWQAVKLVAKKAPLFAHPGLSHRR